MQCQNYIRIMVTVIRKVEAYTALEQSITVYLVNVSVNPQTPPREVAFASLSEATQFIQDITTYPDKYLKGLFD